MELDRLIQALRRLIPQELYQLEPGKVFLFIPKKGVDSAIAIDAMHILDSFTVICSGKEVRLNFFPTDNEVLIGNIAIRIPLENQTKDTVVVGTPDTLPGFAKVIFGEEVEDKWGSPSPIIIEIDHIGISNSASSFSPEDSSDDFGMELLQKRPTNEKEERNLIAKYEQKIRKIIWECEYLGLDLDVKAIVDDIEAIKSLPTDGYQLSLNMEYREVSGLIDCKIYVRENEELKLTAIQKAVYLTFLSLEDGIVIEEATPSFTKRIQNIYKLLPDKEQKEIEKNGKKGKKETDEEKFGILHTLYIQSTTLRGYMSEVNAAISKLIPNGLIAIEFAIEGVKDGAFKVIRNTPKTRERIIKAYNL